MSENDVDADAFCDSFDFDNSECSFEELDRTITVQELKYDIKDLTKKSFSEDNLLN